MNIKRSTHVRLALLLGAIALAAFLVLGRPVTPAHAQEAATPAPATVPSTPPPTERIDAEQAVDFPYDI